MILCSNNFVFNGASSHTVFSKQMQFQLLEFKLLKKIKAPYDGLFLSQGIPGIRGKRGPKGRQVKLLTFVTISAAIVNAPVIHSVTSFS